MWRYAFWRLLIELIVWLWDAAFNAEIESWKKKLHSAIVVVRTRSLICNERILGVESRGTKCSPLYRVVGPTLLVLLASLHWLIDNPSPTIFYFILFFIFFLRSYPSFSTFMISSNSKIIRTIKRRTKIKQEWRWWVVSFQRSYVCCVFVW